MVQQQTATFWDNQPRSRRGELAVLRVGSGPALVLLHGVGLRAEAWSAQIAQFAGRFEVIAPDMPGHGESAMCGPPKTIRGYADLVAAHLAEPAHLVGHSMGAMIAIDLAHRYPERVCSLAALNGVFERPAAAARAVRARARALDQGGAIDPTSTLHRWFGASRHAPQAACRRWLTEVNIAAYGAAYRVFAHSEGPTRSALSELRMPALFLTGAEEPNSTPAMSRAMAALAPCGHAEIVAGAAHMMPMTHADTVNTILWRHLSQTL